jgi:hypothetical protein
MCVSNGVSGFKDILNTVTNELDAENSKLEVEHFRNSERPASSEYSGRELLAHQYYAKVCRVIRSGALFAGKYNWVKFGMRND